MVLCVIPLTFQNHRDGSLCHSRQALSQSAYTCINTCRGGVSPPALYETHRTSRRAATSSVSADVLPPSPEGEGCAVDLFRLRRGIKVRAAKRRPHIPPTSDFGPCRPAFTSSPGTPAPRRAPCAACPGACCPACGACFRRPWRRWCRSGGGWW